MEPIADFIEDLNALMRHPPENSLQSIFWLNAILYNATISIEKLSREMATGERAGLND